MFVGLFIGIVFFVSAGSFLYFRLYMDLDDDKQKFSSIAKMGLTDRELGKVIHQQTAILFFAPIRSEEHTSELQSRGHLVCRLLLEKKNVQVRVTAVSKSDI